MPNLLIYGASGYSARLMLEYLKFDQIPGKVILAGRSADKLKSVAEKGNLEYRAFTLDDPSTIEANLQDIHTVVHCAGPFAETAAPMIRAAIKTSTHYMDMSAELESYLLAEELDQQAKDADVTLSPGCGFCMTVIVGLTAHILKRVNEPVKVQTAIWMPGSLTAGTAKSAGGDQGLRRLVRSGGSLIAGTEEATKTFDFGIESGPVETFRYAMPDVVALWRTFELPDISSYMYVESNDFGTESSTADGPTTAERLIKKARATVEVTAVDGSVASSILEWANGYTVTAMAAAEAARRLLNGEVCVQGGFQTVGTLFGEDYIRTFDDLTIRDV